MAYRTIERAERSGCGKAKMGLTLVDAFEAPSIAPEDRPARSMMVDGEWTPAAKTPPVPLPFGDG